MPDPYACIECLRRAHLIAMLAPYIERISSIAPSAASRDVDLLALMTEELAAAAAPDVADQVLARVEAVPEEQLRREHHLAECWATCRHHPTYPAGLADLPDPPAVLFGRGDHRLLADLQPVDVVALVGARHTTAYGRELARQLGHDLAAAGILVVSGLAEGIDACAHLGALDCGKTIAVVPSGPDGPHPKTHRTIWRRICDQGLVVSELPPGTPARNWTHAARSRIVAALAGMTVVVEATASSRTLIAADIASKLSRNLGALPGPVNSRVSAGPNNLLAAGATTVRHAQDVLDAMLGPGMLVISRPGPELTDELAAVLATVQSGEDADAIAARLNLSATELAPRLSQLEVAGYLVLDDDGTYSRTPLTPPTN
jgi:DNA processing protein